MNKGKVARIAGFVGALGLSTVLVTTAVQGTGAWFTDAESGNLTGTNGHLDLQASNTSLNFAGLNPGEDRSQEVTFKNSGASTTKTDVWLVFDRTSDGYDNFTGVSNGLGGYGHFKVVGQDSNMSFESYNLSLQKAEDATSPYTTTQTYFGGATNTCSVDKFGHGGSAAQHEIGSLKTNDLAKCGVPAAILLWKNLDPGSSGSATISYGPTGKAFEQDKQNEPNVDFNLVATQPGISPLATW